MFEQNIANLIDREKKMNILTLKKHNLRNKRSIFPEIKISHLMPSVHISNNTEQSKNANQKKMEKQESQVTINNKKIFSPILANQIFLIARKILPKQINDKKQTNFLHQSASLATINEEKELQKIHLKQIKNLSEMRDNFIYHTQKSELKDYSKNKYYTYYLGPGNNQQLIREIMKTRTHWKQVKRRELHNFKWVSNIECENYKKFFNHNMKRVINHFEFHDEITTKNGLIKNLQIYAETKKQQLFRLTPITFVIDFDDDNCEYNLKQFLYFFLKHQPKKENTTTNGPQKISYSTVNNFIDCFFGYMTRQNSEIVKKINPLSRPIMYPCYLKQNNYIWLLKPTGLNRGRGIEIFDSIIGLEKLLLNFLNLIGRKNTRERQKMIQTPMTTVIQIKQKVTVAVVESQRQMAETEPNPELLIAEENQKIQQNKEIKKGPEQFILKKCSFVIQKYIQQPLLIQQRKFDIRVWVLLKPDYTIYFFKEGYLRTSSEKYSLDISNYFIHLTNNAVQQYSQQYGNYENGNQLSFQQFKEYLIQKNSPITFEEILENMKILCYKTLKSVKSKINYHKRKYCFQIFGFDFFLDCFYKVWLIQVNTNPCIEESSPLLKQLIPRMLNDAFKITIDELFPKRELPQQQIFQVREKTVYSVDKYEDNENMWESLGKLGPNSQYKK